MVFEPHALILNLTAVELSYGDRRAGTSYKGVLKRGRVEPSKTGLHLDLDGTIGGSPFRLKGVTASLSQLMGLARPGPPRSIFAVRGPEWNWSARLKQSI